MTVVMLPSNALPLSRVSVPQSVRFWMSDETNLPNLPTVEKPTLSLLTEKAAPPVPLITRT